MKQVIVIILLGLGTTAYGINPDREYKWTPETRGLKYSEYKITTVDKFSINVWEYGLPDSVTTNRTIILVGTDAGNMSYMIWQAKMFVEKGIRVISFDYRGFGKSSDFKINKDLLFCNEFAVDLDTVIKAARDKYPDNKVGLYSMSMGTYISLLSKEKIDFLIAEGFYHNPQKVAERIKINKDKTVLLPGNAAIIEKLPNIPALIFCADNDKTTMTENAIEFKKHNDVTIIEFKGDHLRGLNVMTRNEPGDEYAERVVGFLERNKL